MSAAPARTPATPDARCLEVAIVRPRAGVTRPQMERALGLSQAWLERQPGFLSRRVAHDAKEDTWVDTIEWRTAEDAHRAMAAYAEAPFAAELNGAIDEASFRCFHAAPVPVSAIR